MLSVVPVAAGLTVAPRAHVCACVCACTAAANEPCDFTFQNRGSSLPNVSMAEGLFYSPAQRQRKSAAPATPPEMGAGTHTPGSITAVPCSGAMVLRLSFSLPRTCASCTSIIYHASCIRVSPGSARQLIVVAFEVLRQSSLNGGTVARLLL